MKRVSDMLTYSVACTSANTSRALVLRLLTLFAAGNKVDCEGEDRKDTRGPGHHHRGRPGWHRLRVQVLLECHDHRTCALLSGWLLQLCGCMVCYGHTQCQRCAVALPSFTNGHSPGNVRVACSGEVRSERHGTRLPIRGQAVLAGAAVPRQVPVQAPGGACLNPRRAACHWRRTLLTRVCSQPIFKPPLYHPNVEQSGDDAGKLCEDFIKHFWTGPTKKAHEFVIHILGLLASPDLDTALDETIAAEIRESTAKFEKKVAGLYK